MSGFAVASRHSLAGAVHAAWHRSLTWIDDVLADSFPASDPPSWAPGMARPAPIATSVVVAQRRLRLLFVSYVEDERILYSVALRAAGFDVRTYDNPARAMDVAVAWQPDVVVTRIMQPGFDLDGIELTRRIRRHPRTRSAAVLIITSRTAAAYREAAAEAGSDALVSLPCGPDELVTKISRIVARRAVATSSLAEG